MLKTIKEAIKELPSSSFADFYQSYIIGLEDDILRNDIKEATATFNSIDDVPTIIKGLNALTQELTNVNHFKSGSKKYL